MEELAQYVELYFGIRGEGLEAIAPLFRPKRLSKGDYLLREGGYVRHLGFVKSGYLRFFALDSNNDREITQWIAGRGGFVTDLSGFYFDTSSRWDIQALSDSDLYTITREDYATIQDHVPGWAELEKRFLAKCFVTLENRVFQQLSMTAEERVTQLMVSDPEVFLNVPLIYIASMLGMTPETLSRVRKKMSS